MRITFIVLLCITMCWSSLRAEKVLSPAEGVSESPTVLVCRAIAILTNGESRTEWPSASISLDFLLSHGSIWDLQFAWGVAISTIEKGNVGTRRNLLEIMTGRLADAQDRMVKRLHNCRPSDFTEVSRRRIAEQFHNDKSREIILLAGIAGVDSLQDEIQSLSKESLLDPRQQELRSLELAELGRLDDRARSSSWGTERIYQSAWAALLVQARNGDKASIARVIETVQTEPDESRRINYLLRDLSYVPQPEVIALLSRYLQSDKSIPGASDYPTVFYAVRAAEVLHAMLEGFPMPHWRFTIGDLPECRKWMEKQTEWKYRYEVVTTP
jgi:hypothetical protein